MDGVYRTRIIGGLPQLMWHGPVGKREALQRGQVHEGRNVSRPASTPLIGAKQGLFSQCLCKNQIRVQP